MYRPEPPYTDGLPPFDKYFYYKASVQSPDEDMEFMDQVYREARGAKAVPQTLREDFCGTFTNCCSWVKRGTKRLAHGVDLDPEPIAYGRANYLSQLKPAERKRISLHQADVLSSGLPKVDMICALNFSYFIFKQRKILVDYFKNCLSTLKKDGILVIDCFGGADCHEPSEEETEFEDLKTSYFWDQDAYDPLTNHATFHIHFRRKGERKRKNAFTYDWRMWSIPELKDALLDAGFANVNIYWEGSTPEGEGDGIFAISEQGEACSSFVAYLAALK